MVLSAKQRTFINEYFKCGFNATEAARRAGYAHPNKQGPRLLVNVGVAEEINRRLSEGAMGPEEVLYRLGEQARAEYSAYINAAGAVDLGRMIADGKAHLIKGVKETAHGRTIEFYDGQTALQLIGKAHGLFTDRVEHEGETTLRVVYGDAGTDDSTAATA